MSDYVRVGVISTSWWADMMHLPSLKSHPRADVVAICGRNRDRAEEMAQKYEIPQTFTDYQEMIARGGIQAIVIAAPDDLHYPMTMAALDAGLHVLCEKPLALNVRQAEEMTARAEAAGVKHMALYTWRWLPYFQYLRELIEKGYLGRCYHCHFRWLAEYGRDTRYRWKWDRRRSLGTLGDLGSHMIDLAQWYVGDIAKVSAHLSTCVEKTGLDGHPLDQVNDSAVLTIEFENGAQGMIHVSTVAHLGDSWHEQEVVLHGESGTLEVNCRFGGGYTVRGARHDEKHIKTLPIPEHILGDIDPNSSFLDQQYRIFTERAVGDRLFIDAIVEDRAVSPNFNDGLKVQKVIDAVIEADQRECWIPLRWSGNMGENKWRSKP